jgi:sister chromatid cohesion protein DCC1
VTSSPSSSGAPGIALLDTGAKIYQMRQKNTSNPIMLLKPSATGPTATDDPATFIPEPSVSSISKIEDTIELVPYEAESAEKALPKVNKWHEKFAKGRAGAK